MIVFITAVNAVNASICISALLCECMQYTVWLWSHENHQFFEINLAITYALINYNFYHGCRINGESIKAYRIRILPF